MSEVKAGYQSNELAESSASDLSANEFLVRQMLSKTNTATLVKIVAVTNKDEVLPVGFVDVVPLVNQLDGYGNAIPHGIIHHLPYARIQGGTNAFIMDPKVGDIGIAVFAQQDISSVKTNKKQSNPGSHRRNDYADGLYIGGFLNGTPVQYVRFTDDGIIILSPKEITVTAPNVTVNASDQVTVNSPTAVCSGDVIASGISLVHHVHGGVEPGGGNTGQPV
jgi:hypothetical protein